jgi:predicted GTPase
MNAATIAQLLVLYAIPLVDKLMSKWQSGGVVTAEEWAEIRAVAKQSAADRMKAQLVLAGIPLDSDRAKELLALVG